MSNFQVVRETILVQRLFLSFVKNYPFSSKLTSATGKQIFSISHRLRTASVFLNVDFSFTKFSMRGSIDIRLMTDFKSLSRL